MNTSTFHPKFIKKNLLKCNDCGGKVDVIIDEKKIKYNLECKQCKGQNIKLPLNPSMECDCCKKAKEKYLNLQGKLIRVFCIYLLMPLPISLKKSKCPQFERKMNLI